MRGVVRHYGAVRAVDGVDLDIRQGEIFGLIGHNGAGKSTLFRLLLGLERATAGDIRIDAQPVRGRGFRAVRRRIGYLPENVAMYDNLSGIETLRFFARLKGVDPAGCAAALARVGLAAAAARPVREYSKGMRQRLGLAQALLGEPQVLFLDEPTNGLDPQAIRDVYAVLRELRERGTTIVVTSHILAELQERVDRLAIIERGRIRAVGSVDSLRASLDLPLQIRARFTPGALHRACTLPALATLQQQIDGDTLLLELPREAKMATLAALAALGSDLLDLGVREPSLEDLFFGLREAA